MEKYVSIKKLSEALNVTYNNLWHVLKKLNVNYRIVGFRKKEYDIVDFVEKLKKHNPLFFQLKKEKLLSLLNEEKEKNV